MKKTFIASAIAAAATVALSASAYACPNGYKTVWIQGNPVCMLDVSPTDKLKANTGPEWNQSQNFQAAKPKRAR
jgi:hypothetical protein